LRGERSGGEGSERGREKREIEKERERENAREFTSGNRRRWGKCVLVGRNEATKKTL
jgi:hypothetical protein